MELPNDSQRHLIIGRTGSGKTQFGVWTLSQRSITAMPWVILNFKNDDLIDSIPHANHLESLKLPKKLPPGIHVAHPDVDEWDGVEELLKDIWKRQNTGLFVDETLEISQPLHPGYRRLLTQGRSRSNPVVSLTQRPVDIDRYAFSESEFLNVFALSDEREAAKIKDQKGVYLEMDELPEYHSYKWNSLNRKLTLVKPSPDVDSILKTFDARLKRTQSAYFI